MNYHLKILVCISVLISVFPGVVSGQHVGDNFSAFGLDVGYYLTPGEWNQHLYAPGVNQFAGSYYISGAFCYRFQPRLGALAYIFYAPMDVSEWEKFVQDQGDALNASAYATGILLGMQVYLLEKKPNLLSLDLNWGWIHLSGKETYESFSYNYDFLKSSIAVALGIGYNFLFTESVAFSLNVKGFYIFQGIRYSEGESHDVIMLPVTAGIRYLF